MTRGRRWALGAGTALALLALSGWALLHADLGGAGRWLVLRGLPGWQARTGCTARLGTAHLRLWPRVEAEVRDVESACGDGPWLRARRVHLIMPLRSLWQPAPSLIDSVEEEGLELHLAHLPDGRLAPLDRIFPHAPPPQEVALLKRLALGRFDVRDGALEITAADPAQPALRLGGIDLHVAGLAPGQVLDVDLGARDPGGPAAYHLRASFGPLPSDVTGGGLALLVKEAELHVDRGPLAPWVRALPEGLPIVPAQGVVNATIRIDGPVLAGLRGKATLRTSGLVLRGGAGQAPADLELGADLAADPVAGKTWLEIKTLRLAALGATLRADGSTLDLLPGPPRLHLLAEGEDIDLDLLSRARAWLPALERLPRDLAGRLRFSFDAAGAGDSPEAIFGQLRGQLTAVVRGARFLPPPVPREAVPPLLSRIFGEPQAPRPVLLREVALDAQIEPGRLRLHPLRVAGEAGTGRLQGVIGLARHSLALEGTFVLEPAYVVAASGGRLTPSEKVPVDLRIHGALSAPQVKITNVSSVAAALIGGSLRRIFGQ